MNKFIYLFLGLIFFLAFYIILQKSIFQKKKSNLYPYTFQIYYTETNGILKDDKVFIQGVQFGVVKSIDIVSVKTLPVENQKLYQNHKNIIEITIALKKPITIWKNYSISFHPDNTTLSRRVINIDIGNQKINEFVEKIQPFKKSTIIQKINLNADYYDNFSYSISEMLYENQADIKNITNNLSELSQKLKSTNGTLPRFLNSDEMYKNFLETSKIAQITAKEARWYQESVRHFETAYPFSITTILINKFIFKKTGTLEKVFSKKSKKPSMIDKVLLKKPKN